MHLNSYTVLLNFLAVVFWACLFLGLLNTLPQTGRLQTSGILSLTLWEDRSWPSSVTRSMSPEKSQEGILASSYFLVLQNLCQASASTHVTSCHKAILSLYLSSFKVSSPIGLWDIFILSDDICGNLFPNKVTFWSLGLVAKHTFFLGGGTTILSPTLGIQLINSSDHDHADSP